MMINFQISGSLFILTCIGLSGCSIVKSITDTNPCHLSSESTQHKSENLFIFNQSHQDNAPWWWIAGNAANTSWRPQSVPVNSCIQIQLPAGPTKWELIQWTLDKKNIDKRQLEHAVIKNTGRFWETCQEAGITESECPNQIRQYQFAVTQPGRMRIGLRVSPPLKIPVELAKQQNGFRYYQLTLNVTATNR